MAEKGSIELRLREIDERRSHLLEKIKRTDLINEKYKKT